MCSPSTRARTISRFALFVGLRTFNEVFGLLANTCRWQVKGGKVIADGSNVEP